MAKKPAHHKHAAKHMEMSKKHAEKAHHYANKAHEAMKKMGHEGAAVKAVKKTYKKAK